MNKQRYEYRVAFVDFRGRASIEGEEILIQDGERMTAFGRRVLNALGEQGWELVDIQPQPAGNAFHVFKRPLAEGESAEPARPVERAEPRRHEGPQPQMHPFGGPPPGYGMWFHAPVPPPIPPMHGAPPGDVLIHFGRRGPGDAGPQEFDPPLP
jgi:hypothetical protein